ncbi:hypothetical protein [Sphingobium sp. MK2]|uniref:hypothetical protein n=1 Tax=Sphingobium sp. MK2 TaxID=3116540 RepID=UPI0032E364F6
MDTRIDKLLTLVIEESSEVIKERCKIADSGEDFVPYADQGRTATNLDNLKTELVDLHTVLGILIANPDFITIGEFVVMREAKLASLRKHRPWIFQTSL